MISTNNYNFLISILAIKLKKMETKSITNLKPKNDYMDQVEKIIIYYHLGNL